MANPDAAMPFLAPYLKTVMFTHLVSPLKDDENAMWRSIKFTTGLYPGPLESSIYHYVAALQVT